MKVFPDAFPKYKSLHLAVVHKPTLTLLYDVDDWHLYAVDGADAVAQKLNVAMMTLINTGFDVDIRDEASLELVILGPIPVTRDFVYSRMMNILDKHREFGGMDSQVLGQVRYVLDMTFGRSE